MVFYKKEKDRSIAQVTPVEISFQKPDFKCLFVSYLTQFNLNRKRKNEQTEKSENR
jgi:hypothetical protein